MQVALNFVLRGTKGTRAVIPTIDGRLSDLIPSDIAVIDVEFRFVGRAKVVLRNPPEALTPWPFLLEFAPKVRAQSLKYEIYFFGRDEFSTEKRNMKLRRSLSIRIKFVFRGACRHF